MGQISSAPVELIRVQRGGGKSWKGAVAEMQGWRADHEDAHFMKNESSDGGYSIFGVLDGHGGSEVARFAAHDHLPEALRRAVDGSSSEEALDREVSASFVETDAWLRENPEVTKGQSGSTCVVAGLRRRREDYEAFIANAGDSRGLVVRRRPRPQVLAASDDHKPDREDEHARIVAAGGFVSDANIGKKNNGPLAGALANVVARLDGNLAVSRGLGDFAYKRDSRRPPKEQKVSCVPEIYRIDSTKTSLQQGDLVILACDGIFDVMSNQDVASAVADSLERGIDLGEICAQTLTTCLRELNSKDNMTLMVIEVGIDGTDYDSVVDEILGVDMYDSQNDAAVKKSFISFLQYCESDPHRTLPDDAQELLRRAARDDEDEDDDQLTSSNRYHDGPLAADQRRRLIIEDDDDDELEEEEEDAGATTTTTPTSDDRDA